MWYARQNQTQFMAALDKRDEQYERRNVALVQALNQNTEQLRALTELVIRMDQRSCEDEPVTQPVRKIK